MLGSEFSNLLFNSLSYNNFCLFYTSAFSDDFAFATTHENFISLNRNFEAKNSWYDLWIKEYLLAPIGLTGLPSNPISLLNLASSSLYCIIPCNLSQLLNSSIASFCENYSKRDFKTPISPFIINNINILIKK